MLSGRPVLTRTIEAFAQRPDITWILPVIHHDHGAFLAKLRLPRNKMLPPVMGGTTRQASVLAGLEALAPNKPDLVLIQDAARPLVDAETIDGVIAGLGLAAVPAIPVTDTIKRTEDGRHAVGAGDRDKLFAAQT